ncbi:inositol monophosphatase family protein [Erysipelothrix piscisicarius]|uniref:inositol-phosphate phosphatase n=1 Tax=Erysipelothrix piscisicarius TaxID=2485784 RepID=A0A3Q8S6F6_9FIRM|nr:inositol monophosphatase family protein [Erysipelothrix piscisicarius]AZK43490.1 inositol monophosphatase family protein [Erysipelothrix piscisicarius]
MNKKAEFTIKLVRQAGERIKTMMQESIDISLKSSRSDFVTNVDKQTEIFLVSGIKEAYSNQNFLTEEKTVETMGKDHLWIIDPIDGTTNFIYQKQNFSISVGYYHQGMPVFGIVYDVMADEMFVGIVGEGAYLNGQKLAMLDQDIQLKDSIISGDVYRPGLFKMTPQELKLLFITHRFLGSGALEVCHIAAGRWQSYVFPKLKVWDFAAAVIVLTCVGGTYHFGDLEDTLYFDNEPRVFIAASNQTIKESLKALL